jgi:hypothetical protein
LYDIETGKRTSLGDVDLDYGLLIHAPAQQARCDLYRVDLRGGIEAAQLASRVRKWQKRKDLVAIQAPPDDDLTQMALEALESAFKSSVVVGSQERRNWLKERIQRLISIADAKKELVALWPADIPKLSGDHEHTDPELDAIIAVVDSLEAAHGLPFFGTDPNHPPLDTGRQVKPKTVKPKTIDEGAEVSAEDVKDVKSLLGNLNRQQLAFVSSIADQTAEAGHPISLRALPSVRRYKVTLALIDLAEETIDETGDLWLAEKILRHVANDTHNTLGHVVGNYTIKDADQLKKFVSDLNDGLIEIAIGDDGSITLTQQGEKTL